MNFDRVKVLMTEIDTINAILNNDEEYDFNNLFKNCDDMLEEEKMNKLCEITYKILENNEFENDLMIIRMFDAIFPENEVGEFCIQFIRLNLMESRGNVDERIDMLVRLNIEKIPNSQIKIDYLNVVLTMLLQQKPLNMELINKYNNLLKELVK
jgi:hypothetical protein